MPKDLGNTCSEAMNTRGTKQGKNVHAKPSSFPSNEQYRNRGFFFHMLIKWLYLFWEFPGLSMAVTDLFRTLIYFFMVSTGTCVFIPVGLLLLLLLLSLFSPYHIWKISFWHIWKWRELWETFGATKSSFTFSAANIPAWDGLCFEYSLTISVVTFPQIKSTSACCSLGKGWWAVFWQLYIKCRWLHECIFCLTQYINHNLQFLPKELEWIKLFNKTLLTWINSFLFCI